MESLSNRSEYSELLPLPTKFVLENAHVSWAEIRWAHEMGLIGWRTLKEYAAAALQGAPEDQELSRLAHLTKEEAGMAEEITGPLAARDPAIDRADVQKKWLCLLLKQLYENKSRVSDPLGVVEQIYADFDYPAELESFVRWMPSSAPVGTPEEAAARMDRNWRTYLEKCVAAVSPQPRTIG